MSPLRAGGQPLVDSIEASVMLKFNAASRAKLTAAQNGDFDD